MSSPRFTLPPALAAWQAPLRARWAAMAPRERLLIGVGVAVVVLFLLWLLFVLPAWRTVRAAPAQLDQLDAQLQQMQRMAAEARELHDVAPLSAEQAGQALQAATQRLGGHAHASLQGDRAVVNFNAITGHQLSDWLGDVRAGARGRPLEAQLSRGPQGYSGTVVIAIGSPAS